VGYRNHDAYTADRRGAQLSGEWSRGGFEGMLFHEVEAFAKFEGGAVSIGCAVVCMVSVISSVNSLLRRLFLRRSFLDVIS
jgi:hypothetical protein